MTRHQSFAPSTGAFIVVPEENEKSEPFSNRKQVRIFLVWWARVDYASRAAKNSLAGCFCPAGRKAPGRSCSHPPAYVSLTFVQKKTASVSLHQRFFHGRGWIRTTEAEKQQIYSLSPLATREHAHILFAVIADCLYILSSEVAFVNYFFHGFSLFLSFSIFLRFTAIKALSITAKDPKTFSVLRSFWSW